MRRTLPTLSAAVLVASLAVAGISTATTADVIGVRAAAMRSSALDLAAERAMDGLAWVEFDMHLHTDHSSDGGLFHQQEKDQRNQDTFLSDQRDQAVRTGMDVIAFTDHRNFGQHYDPDFDLTLAGPLSGQQILVTGEEWGGGRHGTAFAIQGKVEHGSTDRVGCGLAEMALEVAAQDGLLGMAHPKDGGADACMQELIQFPVSHVEALRGGDNELQEAGIFPGGGNGSNTAYYQQMTQAGGRIPAVNGSDNHFKQVWPGPSGPGGSAAHILVEEVSEAGIIDAVRSRRTVAGWGASSIRVTTMLDADRDGTFDAITGGFAEPSGDTVTLGLAVDQGVGHTVQVWDDTGAIVAQTPITLPAEVVAFDLPAASAFYRVSASTSALTQVGLPDPLDYLDTLVMNSTPVWTTPGTGFAEAPSAVAGDLQRLSDAGWSGLADLAADGRGGLHAVWRQRTGTDVAIAHRGSDDGGVTWGPTTILARGDARTPAVSAAEDRVVVAWEVHDPQRFGGAVVTATSLDGGVTFSDPVTASTDNAARPALASTATVDHLVFQQQQSDGTWAVHHQVLGGPISRLSNAQPFSGGMTTYAFPPRELMHIPASTNPVIAVDGDTVAVAWEDNRQDQTPGRSDSPDDWGIFGTISVDGGATFEPDSRWTPRRLRRDDTSDPEGVQGNPALAADLAFGPDGALHLAFTDTFESIGHTDVWTQASPDGGRTWRTPVRIAPAGQWAYHPQLTVDDDGVVTAVWQQAADPTWSLVMAQSTDAGQTFDPAQPVTDGGRYAGWPVLVDGIVGFTAETPQGFGVHVTGLPDPA